MARALYDVTRRALRRSVALNLDSIIDMDDDVASLVVSTARTDYQFNFSADGRSCYEACAALDSAEQSIHAGIDAARRQKEAAAALVAEAERAREEHTALAAQAAQQQSAVAIQQPKVASKLRWKRQIN